MSGYLHVLLRRSLPLAFAIAVVSSSRAEIYRWDTGGLIPNTVGIQPAPEVQLSGRQLQYADLRSVDLSDANFEQATVRYGKLSDTILTRANLRFADFQDADLRRAILNQANLERTELTNAVLASAMLTDARLHFMRSAQANFTGAAFTNSDLTGADFTRAILTDADFTNAIVNLARLDNAIGLTAEQFYSTLSYTSGNLAGISFAASKLERWNLAGKNLEAARFYATGLNEVDLRNANLSHTAFSHAFLQDSLLSGADLTAARLDSSQLHRIDLSNAKLRDANLEAARLDSTNVAKADFSGAIIRGADLSTTIQFAADQLYETASYQTRDLRRLMLNGQDLHAWRFLDQNLSSGRLTAANLTDAVLTRANLQNVDLSLANLTRADLSGVDLKNANLDNATLVQTTFDATTVYNQWTIFPVGFDANSEGLTFALSETGDFDGDDFFDMDDVDLLWSAINSTSPAGIMGMMFDLNDDSTVDNRDVDIWVREVRQTWFGDADLNGEFNSTDLVQVFGEGRYEQGSVARWSQGDWNLDGLFDSEDFVVAFQDGGYELGPRLSVFAVPEPTACSGMSGIGLTCFVSFLCCKRRDSHDC
ncbi:MAG: pentapeptide repeat-containing protein [Planctomycetales bacterium]|nr:pentapeptide repeat-containing protein [Planctomycetales bacterium]